MDDYDILITISTNGELRFWDILMILDEFESWESKVFENLKEIYNINTLSRLLCMDIVVEI